MSKPDGEQTVEVDEKAALNQHVDKAAQFLAETEDYPPLSAAAEKKLMRKVDWIMIPVVRSSVASDRANVIQHSNCISSYSSLLL
jgi:hypothetical protein